MTLKPSIVLLLACVHSLKHCEMGLEQHVYQCFSNHPTVCQFLIFYFTGIQNIITCTIPSPPHTPQKKSKKKKKKD